MPGAGRGVFCRDSTPVGTVLGAYPGRLRAPTQVLAKVSCSCGRGAGAPAAQHLQSKCGACMQDDALAVHTA